MAGFSESGANGSNDVLAMRLTGDRDVIPIAATEAHERSGQLSPRGGWVAYSSERSGAEEIYVQPFPAGGPPRPVSVGGGREPLWSHDGTELFYVSATGDRLMAVTAPADPSGRFGQPRLVAEGTYRLNLNSNTPYAMHPDGRFLRIQPTRPDGPVSRIEVILNWKPKGS